MGVTFPYNRMTDTQSQLNNPMSARCIGSACMMWHWVQGAGADPRRGGCGLAFK